MKTKILFTSLLILGHGRSFAQFEEASEDVREPEVIVEDTQLPSQGRISLTGRILEEYEEYATGVMLPFFERGPGAAFLDLRGAFIEDLEQEFNAGLVARCHLDDAGIVLGVNAYYDGRWTDLNNRYDQVAGGVELLSRWIDIRANYYYPVTDATMLDEKTEVSEQQAGNRRIRTSTTFRYYEEALDGYDAEAGVWLPWISKYVPMAIYGGYYQFNSALIDDDHFGGAKARVEARVHPNVTVAGEWFEESALNDSEYIASIRVQTHLDFWRRTKLPKSGGPYHPLRARILDEVQRDLRVRVVRTGPVEFKRDVQETLLKPSPVKPKPQPAPTPQPAPIPAPAPLVCSDVFVTDPVTGTITVTTVCK